ncbi:unnamed protein product [Pleuronectes platessa]|uniref:Uncharacterized protein n=1 Tax=Pleuronectes platessa TaxID=8262 RepID=A0A9N7V1B0_PLEPL|nr:unnamed protein product [Pleuronectes platessa]
MAVTSSQLMSTLFKVIAGSDGPVRTSTRVMPRVAEFQRQQLTSWQGSLRDTRSSQPERGYLTDSLSRARQDQTDALSDVPMIELMTHLKLILSPGSHAGAETGVSPKPKDTAEHRENNRAQSAPFD